VNQSVYITACHAKAKMNLFYFFIQRGGGLFLPPSCSRHSVAFFLFFIFFRLHGYDDGFIYDRPFASLAHMREREGRGPPLLHASSVARGQRDLLLGSKTREGRGEGNCPCQRSKHTEIKNGLDGWPVRACVRAYAYVYVGVSSRLLILNICDLLTGEWGRADHSHTSTRIAASGGAGPNSPRRTRKKAIII
jgi:hypothetical protein